MAGSSISQAKMRSAKAAAKAIVKKQVEVELPPHVIKARASFAYFCEMMGKKPARHMREWHKVFLTGNSNDHLLDIAGPNTCLLSPRGSAKSTVLGLLLGWLIGRHALSKKLLRILYVSYNVDVPGRGTRARRLRTSSARRNTPSRAQRVLPTRIYAVRTTIKMRTSDDDLFD